MSEQLQYTKEEVTGVGNAYIAFAIEKIKAEQQIHGGALINVVGFSYTYDRDTHPHVGPAFDWLEKNHLQLFQEAVEIGYQVWKAMKEKDNEERKKLLPKMENTIGHAIWLLTESGDPKLQEAAKQIVI